MIYVGILSMADCSIKKSPLSRLENTFGRLSLVLQYLVTMADSFEEELVGGSELPCCHNLRHSTCKVDKISERYGEDRWAYFVSLKAYAKSRMSAITFPGTMAFINDDVG